MNIRVELLSFQVEGDAAESATALRVCGEKVVREFCKGQPLAILEPAMQVEFRTEGESFGALVADVSSARRGEVCEVSVEGREKIAHAVVPLKEMIGYK